MSDSVRGIIQGDWIGSCNATLSNGMQCRRPAGWIVLDAEGNDTPFQLCNRCKVLQDAGIAKVGIFPFVNTGTVEALPSIELSTPAEVSTETEGITEGEKESGNSTPAINPTPSGTPTS
jgi:hypothetical protein